MPTPDERVHAVKERTVFGLNVRSEESRSPHPQQPFDWAILGEALPPKHCKHGGMTSCNQR